jgi:catechol-2,3-dioxygenase
MSVLKLDHINLKAPGEMLEQLREFYCDVVGLKSGERPPFQDNGYWLYAGDRAVVHLSEVQDTGTASVEPVTTFNHVAFACSGRAAAEKRLAESGVDYRVAIVPVSGQTQLFCKDPAGNGVELSFASDDS